MNQNILNGIHQILNNHGIFFDQNPQDTIIDMDSIQFVSVLCSLEDHFEVEIPDIESIDPEHCSVIQLYTLIAPLIR